MCIYNVECISSQPLAACSINLTFFSCSFPRRSYPSWVLHIRMRLWLVICQIKHYIWCINLSRRKPDSLSLCLSVYLSFINRVHLLVCLAWIRIRVRIQGEYSVESCTNKRLLACNFGLLVTFCDDNKRNMKWSTSTMKEDLSLSPSLSVTVLIPLCSGCANLTAKINLKTI